jgi:uncharacterized protein YjeT (DUF2065 family)
MVTVLAGMVVMLSAAYLLGFGVLAVAGPARAFGHLRRLASTFPLHVLELLVRFAVGAAFVAYASEMQFGGAFRTFGIIIVITTLGLAVLPWRWHRWVAQLTLPAIERHVSLLGIASIAAGSLVLWAVVGRFLG